jgi:hypothetical protein
MRMGEVVDFLGGYARSFAAPVEEGTTVLSVEAADGGSRPHRPRCVAGRERRD